jgi:pimeloyl-ACP methyl ester carboxylesterase
LFSDWPVWLGLQLTIRKIQPPMGVPMKVIKQIDPEDDAWLQTLLSYVLPVQPRREGLLNDLRTVIRLDVFPLDQIQAPTLVIHTQDDTLVSIKHGRFSAEHIPGARLVELPSGGHLLIGQRERIRAEVESFLKELNSD